jgi:hypothetical protein
MGLTIMDAQTKGACIELIYVGPRLGSSRREVAKRLVGKYSLGVGAKYLLEQAGKLPSGLVNDSRTMTLRRAVNKLVGLDKPKAADLSASGNMRLKGVQRSYTNFELMEAVLGWGALPLSVSEPAPTHTPAHPHTRETS